MPFGGDEYIHDELPTSSTSTQSDGITSVVVTKEICALFPPAYGSDLSHDSWSFECLSYAIAPLQLQADKPHLGACDPPRLRRPWSTGISLGERQKEASEGGQAQDQVQRL